MSYTTSLKSTNNIATSTLITTTSIDDELSCNSGVYHVTIVWLNDLTIAEKNAVRASFNIYGRAPVFQVFPDGSEGWAFVLQNMNTSVVVQGQCRSETVDDEIEDNEEVDTQRVRNPNR
ncbi:hypothetical protein [uncultured Dokdonia sp.]|uniref:hypothetical protein n=1 Tax=uncultured Dokdonia sp. TaxID=575653 RepID=UPI002639CA7B|nr:hypothetical protein [uncultured Dokdonia sp.]